ncbi:adenylate/guanylate cyclase domain-containing protein [Nocardia otitidiscaviarum]|uniref:adenylate/guanylate cyclase domain-containing protein n=1 Tax=Nocardia otitidiscaviarum TaxID=1823 RepID=UPI0004A6AAC2|nr:adenylate/guanylate cyclase domain-containing protein [Nocardia otitidiscaviarum]MBF6133343.1 adenylate/guanylate cyclase domain-containing protein [Nocardia otitidiscaviarum]MBF6240588.1 adenylate/guanylate cyclase domain-containing protein [Nocardia otitidiscaviarum]MBF6486739.1 adenylate/guanylate cyclase domain-containing protein [Nocardia otitidiscaviarum]
MVDSDVTPRALGAAPFGSRLLGPADQGATSRRVRVQLLLTVPVLFANLTGVVVAALLIGLVLPGPSVFTQDLVLLNFVAVPVYVTFALAVGFVWGTLSGLRTLRWATDPERIPNEAERIASSKVPRRLVHQQALLWFGGMAVLTPLYGLVDPAFVPKIILGVGFSAVVVCANSYLITEFALRLVTARVLEAEPRRRQRGLGVFGRSLLVWMLGSGTPVALLMIVAVLALSGVNVSTERLAVCVLSLGGATLVFGLLLMTQTLAATVAPIRNVRTAMRRVEDGDLQVAVTVYDGTELGELQSGFNHMVAGLREREQIRDLFGRHVGRDVAAAALAGQPELGGEECEAAALFIDVIGSTAMTATRPPHEIVTILNEFFGIVVDEVERHGGLVNKFEGDAALAIFGTPAPLTDAAGAALASARAIRRRLSDAAIEFDAAIGVAAGRVVAGNVGAHRRYEFTVIGDPVNEAARLCELAKQDDGRVLASATAVSSAEPSERKHWDPGESVTLRGRVHETRLARPHD